MSARTSDVAETSWSRSPKYGVCEMSFVHLLWTITVPILVVCAADAFVARYQEVETRSLSTVALYLLAPAFILSALPTTNLRDHVVHIVVFTAAMTAFCWLAAVAASRLFRLDHPTSRALMLTTIFNNSNNYRWRRNCCSWRSASGACSRPSCSSKRAGRLPSTPSRSRAVTRWRRNGRRWWWR